MKIQILVCLALIAIIGAWSPSPVYADVGPPAHLQITETEEGVFRIQWRVPNTLPPRAVPTPDLPESCAPLDEPVVSRLPGAWLFQAEWRCDEGLAGHRVGLRFPFRQFALTTVIRVELLSGDRFAHLLSPGEENWLLPEGTAAPDFLGEAQATVLAGVLHALRSWLHYFFLIVLVALGGSRRMFSLVSAFTLGQVAGVVSGGLLPPLPPPLSEIGFAVAIAVLARQALLPLEQRSPLVPLCVVVGLVHGLGVPIWLQAVVGGNSLGWGAGWLSVLGMDAAHLGVGLLLAGVQPLLVRRSLPGRMQRISLYALGICSVAIALGLATGGEEGGEGDASAIVPTFTDSGGSSATPASQRLAPAAGSFAVQSFFVVAPFELRHEVMVRVWGMAPELGLENQQVLSVEEQPVLRSTLAEWILDHTRVQLNGEEIDGMLRRVDFMSVDPTGALPRPNPIEESLDDAVVGVVIAYPVSGMPESARLSWDLLPAKAPVVPCTLIDPENVETRELSAETSSVVWENTLLEDPIPQVSAIPVEPLRIPVPWISIVLLLLALILLASYLRGGRESRARMAAVRIVLALAVLAGPFAESAVAVSSTSARVPSERQARRILAGLIPNIYRAMEYREEAVVYDQLAVSVTGESLADVYIQQRKALELEERGGAQARVESVEILEATELNGEEAGFSVLSTWTVGGMVTHFGHRHFRQNRYRARLEIVAVSETWKIRHIEVLEQDRLK